MSAARLIRPMSTRKTPETEVPHTPVSCWSAEPSSSRAPASARMPKASSITMTKTTEEWPRLNQKPTLIGR